MYFSVIHSKSFRALRADDILTIFVSISTLPIRFHQRENIRYKIRL